MVEVCRETDKSQPLGDTIPQAKPMHLAQTKQILRHSMVVLDTPHSRKNRSQEPRSQGETYSNLAWFGALEIQTPWNPYGSTKQMRSIRGAGPSSAIQCPSALPHQAQVEALSTLSS